MLGARESGTARLEEAVAAYRAALEERTRERVPLARAYTRENLANGLALIAERTGDRASMTEAVTAMRDAAEIYRQDNISYKLSIIEPRLAELQAALEKMS
jgi:hypothetical protein